MTRLNRTQQRRKGVQREAENGFTLIELLVVIAIIGILASIVFTATKTVRVKARDARRIADLRQMANALELYSFAHDNYPPDAPAACDTSKGTSNWVIGVWDCAQPTGNYWDAAWLAQLDSDLIARLAVDPLNKDEYYYMYEPVSVGQYQFGVLCPSNICAYILSAKLEDSGSKYANPECNQCHPDHNYCVSGGGALLNTSC